MTDKKDKGEQDKATVEEQQQHADLRDKIDRIDQQIGELIIERARRS